MDLTISRNSGTSSTASALPLASLRHGVRAVMLMIAAALFILGASAANATVTATVSPASANVCGGASTTFTAGYSTSGCEGSPGAATYAWYVDNAVVSGQTASTFTTSFSAGSHTVHCMVTVISCGSGTSPNAAVTATASGITITSATASPTSGTTCTNISFSGAATESCGSGTFSYYWDFGDGQSSSPASSAAATHAYASAGTYSAVLHVSDGGNSATQAVSTPVTLTTPTVTITTASASPTTVTTCNGLVSFTGGASSDCTTGTPQYTWDFGDGQSATSTSTASAAHNYTTAGSFTPIFTATMGGASKSQTLSPITVTTAVAPGAPTGLTATPQSSTTINLLWTASSTGTSSSYTIYKSTDGGATFTSLGTATGTTYSDNGCAPGVSYCYYVKAANACGAASPASNTTCVTVPCNPPASPTGLTASLSGATTVNLSWTAGSAGSTTRTFYIYRGINGANYANIGNTSAATYSDTATTPGVNYCYYVTAGNSCGAASSGSNAACVTIPCNPPASPTGLTATAANGITVNLSWTAGSAGSTTRTFYIYRGINGANYANIGNTAAATYSDTAATPGINYCYYVTAGNSCGAASSGSNMACVTTPACTITLQPPTASGTPTVCAPTILSATAVSSCPGDTFTYDWDFGDSTTVAGVSGSQSHQYATNKGYLVTVTAHGTHGTQSTSGTINVGSGFTVTASATPTSATPCDLVQFSGSASEACGSGTLTYYWTFGDGTSSGGYHSTAAATHQYPGATTTKTYTAVLGVKDGAISDAKTLTITVSPLSAPGQVTNVQQTVKSATEIDLTWDPTPNALSYNVLRAVGSGAYSKIASTTSASYKDTTVSPSTSYKYEVTASACNGGFDGGGGPGPTGPPSTPVTSATPCADQITLSATGSPAPSFPGQSVTFTANITESCAGSPVTTWSMSDGFSGTGASIAHTFSNALDYTINVTTTDNLAQATYVMYQKVWDFGISASLPSVTQGSMNTGQVTLISMNGYNGYVTVSAGSLPTGVVLALIDNSQPNPCPDFMAGGSSVTVQVPGTITVQVCANPTAATGSYPITFTGVAQDSGGPTHTATATLVINPMVGSAATTGNPNMASLGSLSNPGSLLDEVGRLAHPVAASSVDDWLGELHAGVMPVSIPARQTTANAHLWLGEYRLANDEQPDDAIWHFRQVQKLSSPNDSIFGRAAYDTAIALFYARAYQESTDTFRTLLDARTMLPGYDRRQCALWYRLARTRAAYHAQRAAMGIPESSRLDSACGAAALSASLRSLGLPSDRETLLKACRVTGEGSDILDVITAGRHLGVNVNTVTADDRGLTALPKPLIAHVEHDHFVSVTAADTSGVTLLCSDMGGWPGCRTHLTWSQWHAMEADVYATVTAPGSTWDNALEMALTSDGPSGVRVASAGPLAGLESATTHRVMVAAALLRGKKIYRTTPTHAVACGGKPVSLRPYGKHPKHGDPVDLATGEEQYAPAPDLIVHNPNGPNVVWARSYASYRGPEPAYEPTDFGVGWSHPYNIGVYDPGYNNPTNSPNYTPPAGNKYVYLEDGTQVGFTASSVPTSGSQVVICAPLQKGIPVQLEWHYDAANKGGYYVIVGKDRSKVTTGSATSSTGCYVIGKTQDALGHGLKFNYMTPPAVIGSGNAVTMTSLCAWPVLTSISDLSTSQPLLIISRSANRSITSVTDNYGRSVFYHVGTYTNTGVPCGYPQVSLELDQVSFVVPQNTTSPANLYVYGYQNYTNLDGQETTPYLHTVQRPKPSGSGTSVLTINYDPNLACVSSVVDANGNQAVYTDGGGTTGQNATTVTTKDPSGNVIKTFAVSVDSNFMELTRTDGAGRIIHTLAYGDVNNPTAPSTVTDGNNRTWTYHYDTSGHGNLTSSVDPRGHTTTYSYAYNAANYPLGELQRVQESNGVNSKAPVSFTCYEPSGLVQTITSKNPDVSSSASVTTTYTYTALGNIASVTKTPVNNAAGTSTTTFNYTSDSGDSAHGVPAYTQSELLGEPLTITDNLGHTSHVRYDNQGHTITVYDAVGHETDYSYVDTVHSNIDIGQLQSMTYPASGETGAGRSTLSYIYGYEGGPLISSKLYDENGNLAAQTDSTYGPEGELLGVSGGTLAVTYTYDALYRPATIKDGNGNTTRYYYDKAGYADAVTYPGYAGPTPAYNAATGSWDNITGPDSSRNVSYDPAGNLLESIDGKGVETDYTYGGADGELTLVHYPGGQLADRTYGYESSFGRQIASTDGVSTHSFAYDDLDNLTSETTSYTGGPQNLTLGYLYNADGSLRQRTTPAGTFSYSYDAGGRLASLTNPYSETSSWSYLDNDWPYTQTLGDGLTTTLTLDALGKLTAQNSVLNSTNSPLVISSYSAFTHDGVGQTRSYSESALSGSYNGPRAFVYDNGNTGASALGQITSESLGSGAKGLSYAYDAAGNATQITTSGAPLVGLAGPHNPDNEVFGTGWAYDGNGNPLSDAGPSHTYTWDAEDNLTSLTNGSVSFSAGYMDDGRRAWKQIGTGAKTYFLYDGSTPVCELNASGTVTAVNTFGSGLLSRHTSSGSTFYAFDPSGNVVERLNANGLVSPAEDYSAFGQRLQTYGQPDPFGYGGQSGYYTDTETGLIYLTHRYYDPQKARFLNRDPAGYGGGINLYGYCGNGPVENIDPLGLDDDNPYDESIGQYYSSGHWGEDTLKVFNGYGHALNNSFNPVAICNGVKGVYQLGRACGIYAAGKAVGSGLYHGFTDWTSTGDPTKFGESFGNCLIAVGTALAPKSSCLGAFGQCFVAGTPVQMSDGTTKPIEQIQPGDLVLSADPQTGEESCKRVLGTRIKQADHLLTLSFSDTATGADADEIVCTKEHPFYVQGKGFVAAGNLSEGDEVASRCGSFQRLNHIVHRTAQITVPVYNLTIEDDHTYFVGRIGELVHNYDANVLDQLKLFPDEPYARNGYGSTPNAAQRASVPPGMEFDHQPPLVQHYYEGNGNGGVEGFNMTPQGRRAWGGDTRNGGAARPGAQRSQGGQMSAYSKRMKRQMGSLF